jgi:hypothetical protein
MTNGNRLKCSAVTETPESGLASQVFSTSQPAISLHPYGDPRIGEAAKRSTREYDFTNSLIALPVLHASHRFQAAPMPPASQIPPIAVLLLHTHTQLLSDLPLCGNFDAPVKTLAALLHQYAAEEYSLLSTHLLSLSSHYINNMRPVRTAADIYKAFNTSASSAFSADIIFHSIEDKVSRSTIESTHFCNLHHLTDQFGAIVTQAFIERPQSDHVSPPFMVLNYPSQYREFADALEALIRYVPFAGKHLAWIAVESRLPGAVICRCLLGRHVTSANSFWSTSEPELSISLLSTPGIMSGLILERSTVLTFSRLLFAYISRRAKVHAQPFLRVARS